jgi:hypothetical protein
MEFCCISLMVTCAVPGASSCRGRK